MSRSGLDTAILVIGIASIGGLVHFLQHVVNGKSPKPFRYFVIVFVADVVTSAFCGFLILSASRALGSVDLNITVLLAGIAGHMGTRLLFVSENLLLKILKERIK